MKLKEVKDEIEDAMTIYIKTIVRTSNGVMFTTGDEITHDDIRHILERLNIESYVITPFSNVLDEPRLQIELFDLFLEDEENDNSNERELYRLRKELGTKMSENMKLKSILEINNIKF
jgi:hypothetical protein